MKEASPLTANHKAVDSRVCVVPAWLTYGQATFALSPVWVMVLPSRQLHSQQLGGPLTPTTCREWSDPNALAS